MSVDEALRTAVRRMFNSELEASEAILAGCVAKAPGDPLAHSLSAAVPFYHFVGSRLRPHGGESMQDLILGKGTGRPAGIDHIAMMVQRARRLAGADLSANPRDQNALLAMCVAEGVERDVRVLVYKRWMAGLEHAREAGRHARRLLEVNREAYDAYYVIGLSEYVLSQVPELLRPVARIPGVVGERRRAVQFLEAAARDGCYFQDFARQMLVTIYVEERRMGDALRVAEGLARDFPGSVGFRAELERLSEESARVNL
jgi:hypothetical protein